MPTRNRPQLALLRGKATDAALAGWVGEFAGGDKKLAERYALAVETYLGPPPGDAAERYLGRLSPNTRAAYRYALTEFFEWTVREKGRVLPPHEVTQKDAEDYAAWLATRPYGLVEERLRDGDEPERLAIFETVGKLQAPDLAEIAAALPPTVRRKYQRDDGSLQMRGFHHALGSMVLHRLLVRSPTLSELREDNPRLGIDQWTVPVPEGNTVRSIELEYVFQYSLPEPEPVSRVTVAHRVNALSGFWDVLAQGENVAGGKAILQYNPFRQIKKRVQHGLAADKREATFRSNRLTPEIVAELLKVAGGRTLASKRDAALLWFLVLTGARVSEATEIRRGKARGADEHRWPGWLDVESDPAVVVLRRKGGRLQRLPYPPFALQALGAFQQHLFDRAAPDEAQSTDPAALRYIPPDSPRWRFRDLLRDDAPLFPSVDFWGANSTENYRALRPNIRGSASKGIDYRKPMTRKGATAALHRLAAAAGLPPDDVAKCHPHAIRAFAATAMARMGKPLVEIQAILGHESVTTTEKYVSPEDREIVLSGQAEILGYISQQPAGVPRPPSAKPITTYGVERDRPRPEPGPIPVVARSRPADPRPIPERIRPVRGPAESGRGPVAVQPGPIGPEALPPLPPAESPVLPDPAAVVHETAEGTIVALVGEPEPVPAVTVREGISAGSPLEAYSGLEPTPGMTETERRSRQEEIKFTRLQPRKAGQGTRATIRVSNAKEQVQDNPWLVDHYDPWPIHYGLGEASLLPWYARGNPRANGEVLTTVVSATGEQRQVVVPPIPVLAPDQVYPETLLPGSLFHTVEALSRKWALTEPTKVAGLRRWYGALSWITRGLESQTKRKFDWVPFSAEARVGKDLRAHSDEYLARWFELNADRFSTTVAVFKEKIKRPRGTKEVDPGEAPDDAAAFLRAFEEVSYMSLSQVEDIPGWFMQDDPIRSIYDANREEWGYFLNWIRSVTGAKLSRDRTENRDDQTEFATEEKTARKAEASALIDEYFATVDGIAEASAENDSRTVKLFKVYLKGGTIDGKDIEGIVSQLGKLGVDDPGEETVHARADRKAQLLARAFPEEGVQLADPNMLPSKLFDPEAFRIDERDKTIRHTVAFRHRFEDEHGRDSECVLRRATRGMWEWVKRHHPKLTTGEAATRQKTMLHAVMLSYVAWIVPCPPDIEKAFAARAGDKAELKAGYLLALNRLVAGHLSGEKRQTVEEFAAEFELPPEEVARAADIAAVIGATVTEHAVAPGRQMRLAIAEAQRAEAAGGISITEGLPGGAAAAVRRRRMRRNVGGHDLVHLEGEAPEMFYQCGRLLISQGACGSLADLLPNQDDRILPDALHMMAAMMAT